MKWNVEVIPVRITVKGEIMYTTQPDEIQNDKCASCRFYVWDDSRHKYVCDIKGCYENNKYIEYQGIYRNGQWI